MAFYASLDKILSDIPKEDKIILLGGFDARVGQDHKLWSGTIGEEGVGNCNSNGVLILTKCAELNLIVNNTLQTEKQVQFNLDAPPVKMWYLIDYIIVRARHGCWTVHHRICSSMSIKLMPKRRLQKKLSRPSFNIKRLGDVKTQPLSQAALSNNLSAVYPHDVETQWDMPKTTILQTCRSIFGTETK